MPSHHDLHVHQGNTPWDLHAEPGAHAHICTHTYAHIHTTSRPIKRRIHHRCIDSVIAMNRGGPGSSRMRAVLFSTGLLLLGMVAVSFFGGGTMSVLFQQLKVHAPRPVLNVLVSVSDGNSIYTINGAPAFTFKDDTAFSPPQGDNDYMKSYPLEGSTLVCRGSCDHAFLLIVEFHNFALTTHQVSNAHVNGTFTHVVNGIGLPLYTRLPEGMENLGVFNAVNEYYAVAFSTSIVKDYSSRLPALGSTWLYQPFANGTRPFDASADVAVYDVDLRDVTPQQISSLKNAGSVVICRIIAGAAVEQSPESSNVFVGDSVLPKSATVGAVPGKSGEHFLNIGLPSVRDAIISLIQRAASSGCDGAEYMRTQFTSYQISEVAKPEELAFHQWLTQSAHSHQLFSVLRNEGSLTASYGSSYDVLVQQNVCPHGLVCSCCMLTLSKPHSCLRCSWSSPMS